MSENANFCEHCGAPLVSGANFCEACGQPVRQAPAAQPAANTAVPAPPSPAAFTPPPAAAQPASQPFTPPPAQPPRAAAQPPYSPPAAPARKGNSTLPVILGAVGCLVILCIAAAVIGAIFFVNQRSTTASSSEVVPVPASPVQDGAWPEGIGQQSTSSYFADDFSTSRFDWADFSDEIHSWGIQDQHYALHLKEADYVVWAYLPIDFTPRTVGFDAALVPGYEEGAYGLICHYQDEDNYHYVAIDPLNEEYAIGKYVDSEDIMLMDDWWQTSSNLDSATAAVNHVQVTCLSDQIVLYLNGALETTVSFDAATPGRTAIYAETWEDMPTGGLKVQFDNLYADVQEH